MKVSDYEYTEYEDGTLSDERKEELIKEVKDWVIRGSIALNKILNIGENHTEYSYIYKWLNDQQITIRGISGSISGELQNYTHISKMGQTVIPDVLPEEEQTRLFKELDELKKKGVTKDSEQYKVIRNELIEHNMRLAIWLANKDYFDDLGIEREDLQQMAMEALIKVVDNFDISRGKKFSGYAIPQMYYDIQKVWRNSENNVDSFRVMTKKLKVFEEQMLATENRMMTDDEIKEVLGIKDEKLEKLKKYISYHSPESLEKLKDDEQWINEVAGDERIGEIENNPVVNGVYVDDKTDKEDPRRVDITAERAWAMGIVQGEINNLNSEKYRKVLKLKFNPERKMTYKEIGVEADVSETSIVTIIAEATRKLRYNRNIRKLTELKYWEVDLEEVLGANHEIYEIEETNLNQIVDGIEIEPYTDDDRKQGKDFHVLEEYLYGIDYGEESGAEKPKRKRKIVEKKLMEKNEESNPETENGETNEYLSKISALLAELHELDKMLNETSTQIQSEKDKKQQISEKFAKIKELIQEQKE